MKNLIEAVLNVMNDCKGIEKSLNVGTGRSSYKGVSDKDVKIKVGQSMQKHGLIILPIDIQPTTKIERWEEETNYGLKQKQSVFTETIVKYKLLHKSGEEITLAGYGHGVDSQDKGAGKATTYALKYTLLYTFLVATGHIDDSDNTHSKETEVPQKQINPLTEKEINVLKGKIIACSNRDELKKLYKSDPRIKSNSELKQDVQDVAKSFTS